MKASPLSKLKKTPRVYLFRLRRRWKRVLSYKKRFSNRAYIEYRFRKVFGREVDLENPQAYSDKMQWMKLFYNNPLYAKCADKVAARSYVESKGLGEILNTCYGVYTSPSQIDLDSLPEKFVLKAAHGSSWNLICKDKERLRSKWATWKKILDAWLAQDYSLYARESHYTYVPPRLICEEYLENEDGSDVKDYKFFYFNEVLKIIEIDTDRATDHKRNYYDADLNLMSMTDGTPTDPRKQELPDGVLQKMKDITRDLAKGFAHIRVDLYFVKGKIYFGELTFTDGAGFTKYTPSEFDFLLGSWFELPDKSSPYVMEIY